MPRKSLITVYKSFIRPHLGYGDIIYNQAYNASFYRKLKSIQYNAALAITGAIRGTSKKKLYQELSFKSLQQRHWFRKLCYFYKTFKEQSSNYYFRLIPKQNTRHAMRNSKDIPQCKTNHEYFKYPFFHATNVFKSKALKFIRPKRNSFFNCLDTKVVKLITRLRLGLSNLRYHKFKQSFEDCLNLIFSCGIDVETTAHYLLHYPNYLHERKTLFGQHQICPS